MRFLLLGVAAVLACNRPSPEQARAFDYLLKLDSVDSAHIGAIGNLSRDARAFRFVLEAPDAQARFSDLFDRGQLGGRLVALCGLKVTGSPRYGPALSTMRSVTGKIAGMQGCIMGVDRPVHDVLDEIDMGHLCADYQGANESEEIRAHYRAEGFDQP